MVSVLLQVVRSQIQQLGIIISTQKYYCAHVQKRLNNDISKASCFDMFGHDLCTVVK
jgi:hypothetical protein